ncbi:helix-turn-helix domain-containing protein [Kiloniella antarctica]|uniref:Helix-turn-helix domain-containing protein n=1 Tax=Kiloniella antarctica TaxID=1550907 RepID=A0ABW5BKG5_9PROT
MKNAELVCMVRSLGLSQTDLAELGGVKERQARRWMKGDAPIPLDVEEALHLIRDDIDVMTDNMVEDVKEGDGVLIVYKSNDQLRSKLQNLPTRGKALGPFVGPHQIASLTARELLDEQGIEVDILFAE